MKTIFLGFFIILIAHFSSTLTFAVSNLGIHLLDPNELESVVNMNQFANSDNQTIVTVPIRIDQLDHKTWSKFFDKAAQNNILPLVRLVTEYDKEADAWRQPTRQDVTKFAHFFSSLPWHGKRYVIVFNEPNHAKEWGGVLDPQGYADILVFSSDWFKTEPFDYVILPAGLDSAAPNSKITMDSYRYLDQMNLAQPELWTKIDAWNSHAYPNPGFSASIYRSAKNAMDGWDYELAYLKNNFDVELDVFITETGWDQRGMSENTLTNYYTHAMKNIWSDPRVKAVTPFILNGNNGVFDHFSFLLADGTPSRQMNAFMKAKKIVEGS